MAVRQYVVTIETPEDEDDFQYDVTITRHGEVIFESADPLVPARANIGDAIFRDIEAEDDRPVKVNGLRPTVAVAVEPFKQKPAKGTDGLDYESWTPADWDKFRDALDRYNAKPVPSGNTFTFKGKRWVAQYAQYLLNNRGKA